MSLKHYTIPIFIPELACPFQCVFCNQQKITGKQLIPDDRQIIQIIEDHLASFKEKQRHVEIGFFGGSFTGIPLDEQAHFLDLIQPYLKEGKIQGIRLSTRPDYIDDVILNLLKQKNVTTIELGAQSLDDEVLKASMRGHTAEQTEKASQLILNYGFDLGLQMMIGLPGDTPKKALFTAKRIVEMGASNTSIYPTLVIRGTALHQWYSSGKYQPLSLEEAVRQTKMLIPIFEESNVKIIRIGLHPSEGLLSGDEFIAGPFHPSFKELVMTKLWHDRFIPLMDSTTTGKLIVNVPKGEINAAIGYHGKNKKMLLQKFDKVIFSEIETLKNRTFRVVKI